MRVLAELFQLEILSRHKTKFTIVFTEVLQMQREYLTELNKDHKIDEEIIRQQLYQIDLEEERLKIV
ncbi:hypothetical protein DSL64_28060 [Dyadobacter luteus]|uniref:Uncharacterized protein n=1 Tax=Dyadobacter luteus TaxID=2259619 RepID=A0A3D8Y3V9_9BACT|nr:hypothetical protein DSL64_28060 [Dyadobacter luteus]